MIVTSDIVSRRVVIDAAAQELQRRTRIAAAWSAYYGEMKKPRKTRAGEPDDNVIVNFPRLIVDKGASLLFGDGIEIKCDGAGQGYLDAVWTANYRDTLLMRSAINGGVCGHVWLKLIEQVSGPPRLVLVDPATVSVSWSPEDYEDVTEYRIEWIGVDASVGRAAAFRQVIAQDGGQWLITDQRSDGDNAQWQTVRTTSWAYPFAPIIGCQNLPAPNEYYGMADVEEDFIGICDAINFLLTNMQTIIRKHAHPKTFATGWQPDKTVQLGPDDLVTLPRDAEIRTVEMQSDLSSSIEFYKRLKEALHELAQIPEIATGAVDRLGALSGTALQLLYTPMKEKTRKKRLLYGDMLRELCRRMLIVGGRQEVEVHLEWPDIVPEDMATAATTATILRDVGVSQETLLERMGFDPDAEAAQREKEAVSAGDMLVRAIEQGGSRRPSYGA